MKRILARLTDQSGKLLLPPNPSFQLIEDGKPITNYSLEQIEDMALESISKLRDPRPKDILSDRG